MSTNPVVLGEKYRDTLTGFEGIVTSRTEFLYGCVRYGLEAASKEGNDLPRVEVFDEQRLVRVTDDSVPEPTARTGGDRPTPTMRPTPTRRP